MVIIMKKWKILLVSVLSIILVVICSIAGSYAVIINVTSEGNVDKIINEINIKDLLTNDDNTYNNTYYRVKKELDINDDDMNILINSSSLNNNLKNVLNSVVSYKLHNKEKMSNDDIYNLIVLSINDTTGISDSIKEKVLNKSKYYINDISDFIYDLEVRNVNQ